MHIFLKKFFSNNFKSSPQFGESGVFSKNITVVSKNLKSLLKERRFLYFTKKGPIEIVFNLKHYLSACLLLLVFLFKILQFVFFGISTFFNFVSYKNSEINSQKFTESEIETLKNIANDIRISENSEFEIEEDFEISEFDLDQFEDPKNEIDQLEDSPNIKYQIKERLDDIKTAFSKFSRGFSNEVNYSDEVIFDQFANLASPEMIAIEHAFQKREVPSKRIKKKSAFSYKDLPVVPFIAPRTNKLKIIHFTKKLDLEILQLVNVFKMLKLKPDNIDIAEIDSLLGESSNMNSDEDLIESTSIRFQYLEELKNAIVFLPLKPPMQYYYVSSSYGLRIHPKTKKKQMHYGIDMAGTWQEEVRASADGYVVSAGRNGSFGKSVRIVHKHGVSTLYGHLHKLSVKKGQYVEEGQIIGKMGATGRAVGAHLHYEIKVKNKSVNPYNFISIGRDLLSSSILKD